MRVLLGSGGYRTPERVRLLAAAMRAFFGGAGRLLFVPYALRDHDGYVTSMTERGLHGGYELDGIHRHGDPARAVAEARGLFIGGGNTFRLLNDLYHFGLLDVIRDRLREFHEMNDTPVVGLWEAGLLRCEGGRVELSGAAARVFRQGQPAVDVAPGTDLAGLLGGD